MSDLDHILIATDGSEQAAKAAAFGGDLARAVNARVTIISVLDDQLVVPLAWQSIDFRDDVSSVDTARASIEQHTESTALRNAVDVIGQLSESAAQVQVWGHPATQICDFAAEHAVDLIVIGSHGRSAIKAALLGSVSMAVVNRAPCAVTVVR
ncbi:MAG: universal stress protein [Pseudomonadota bacterium]